VGHTREKYRFIQNRQRVGQPETDNLLSGVRPPVLPDEDWNKSEWHNPDLEPPLPGAGSGAPPPSPVP
jgi:hypothetical protein